MKSIKILNYIILAIIITLFLSPGKYYYGLGFLALLLFPNYKKLNNIKNIWPPIKFYSPLIILFIYYLLIQKYYNLNQSSAVNERYVLGIFIFLAFYLLNKIGNYSRYYLIIAFFIAPATIHLSYMYYDILRVLIDNNYIQFVDIKDVPRVGRRYLSTVLLAGLLASPFIVIERNSKKVLIFSYCFCSLCLLSLGLLDTRASYLALTVSLFSLVLIKNLRTLAAQIWEMYAKEIPFFHIINIILLAIFIFIVISSGSERWSRLIGTTKYVFQSQDSSSADELAPLQKNNDNILKESSADKLATLKINNDNIFKESSADKLATLKINNDNILKRHDGWSSNLSPEEIKKCIRNSDLRCTVDQSAYLRLTRLIESINIVKVFPFGIGYREELYESLNSNELIISEIKVLGGGLGDNLLVENIISFGYIGVLLYMIFFGKILYAIINRKVLNNEEVYLIAFSIVGISCIARMQIDGFAIGLWGYFNAILGILVYEIKRK